MKITEIILTSLIAASVLAHPRTTWGFFVKIGGTYIRLSETSFGERLGDNTILAHGNPLKRPTKFRLGDDGHLYTTREATRLYAGFYYNTLVFGSEVDPITLEVDEKSGKLRSGPFYSCHLTPGPARGIRNGDIDNKYPHCFDVDVYFLPYYI